MASIALWLRDPCGSNGGVSSGKWLSDHAFFLFTPISQNKLPLSWTGKPWRHEVRMSGVSSTAAPLLFELYIPCVRIFLAVRCIWPKKENIMLLNIRVSSLPKSYLKSTLCFFFCLTVFNMLGMVCTYIKVAWPRLLIVQGTNLVE